MFFYEISSLLDCMLIERSSWILYQSYRWFYWHFLNSIVSIAQSVDSSLEHHNSHRYLGIDLSVLLSLFTLYWMSHDHRHSTVPSLTHYSNLLFFWLRLTIATLSLVHNKPESYLLQSTQHSLFRTEPRLIRQDSLINNSSRILLIFIIQLIVVITFTIVENRLFEVLHNNKIRRAGT